MDKTILLIFLCALCSCKNYRTEDARPESAASNTQAIAYAKGLQIEKWESGVTVLRVTSPWPGAEKVFSYALVPKDAEAHITLNKDDFDAIIGVPVSRIVVTSTTHIPALEALGVIEKLVGFPDIKYVSSEKTRSRFLQGHIQELGSNEAINTEMVLNLMPDVVIGFGIDTHNKAYDILQRSNIPVVYNGDWTEETPLGKAEWLKFFAPFFGLEKEADRLFSNIESSYLEAKKLAQKAESKPRVLSGALYKEVWYLPGGKSWATQFIKDANATYIWENSWETGSLSLSLETVLDKASNADFWISPSQFSSYEEMKQANEHYMQFKAFQDKQVYTFARTRGASGGLLYYELAPARPDLVLKDLIRIFHPSLLPEYEPFFYKALE